MTREEIYRVLSDTRIYAVNRLDAHSDHFYYTSKEEAMNLSKMALRYDLSGTWQYHYVKNLQEAPIDFWKVDMEVNHWDTINVPSNIECVGKDRPHYVNVMYPWDGSEKLKPGEVPKIYNPTSSYRRVFTLPKHFLHKSVHISFQGVESSFNLWLNGHYIGYAEDTHTPSLFDLTPFIQEGENILCVQVYKFCSGSWLESQDYWRLSGIFREVYLCAMPEVHVKDLFVKPHVYDDYSSGLLEINMSLMGNREGGIISQLELYDDHEKPVAATEHMMDIEEGFDGGVMTITLPIEAIQLWSAEKPYLYHMILTLRDKKGVVIETIGQKVGFRRFEMKDGVMTLNGRRLVFHGINRHDFSTHYGRAVTKEEMEADAKFMKRYNINAVRTSHYPNQSYWYQLCDEYGIYLIDEANIETHGSLYYVIRNLEDREHLVLPDGKPEWREAVLDRGRNMLERDKNHPSILLWSCGNESHGGENLYLLSEYFKKRDKSRLVHYEGITQDRRYNSTSDIESRMYTQVKDIKAYIVDNPKKPFLLCEYSHAMGNSIGGISKYIELEETYDLYQGGFIWDYIDQCLETTHMNGKVYYGYGGDFGDRPTDAHCIANGMAFANREPKPDILELKYAYQGFKIMPYKDHVKVVNKNLFMNANELEMRMTLMRDGECIWYHAQYADITPLTEGIIPYILPECVLPGEYIITVSMHLREDTKWAQKGYEVAFGQSVIGNIEEVIKEANTPPVQLVICDNNIGVRGEGFHHIFSESNLVSITYKGEEFIEVVRKGIRPTFWRACTDNDTGRSMGTKMGVWKLATEYLSMTRCSVHEEDQQIVIKYNVILPMLENLTCALTYAVNGYGELTVTMDYQGCENTPDMPKFGMDFKIPMGYSHLEWYGNGPKHNYVDKNTWAKLGIHKSTVEEEYVDYTNPQEYGNKTEVRWVHLMNEIGEGLSIEAVDAPMEFSAIHYTPYELETALHPYELPTPYAINVTLCQKQMGVGGDDSWGAPVLPEYLVHGHGNKKFGIKISNYSG